MENQSNILSSLQLRKMVFEKINFCRLGFKNDSTAEFDFESTVGRSNEDDNLYKVVLIIRCLKENEYKFEISLAGYFSFSSNNQISDDEKNILITRNSVAILMPYMRSQITLLTAQPEMDCVVLPPFNINEMINGETENRKEKS